MEKKIKIYKVNDCDWVAAKSLKRAKKWYLDNTGEYADKDAIKLTDEEMLEFMHTGDEYSTEEPISFKERLILDIKNKQKIPYLFASENF